MTVCLRPLVADDLHLLWQWHNEPHLRPFYMRADIAEDEVVRKFTPRLHPHHSVRCRIADVGGVPFGFLQWYPSRSWKDCDAWRAGLTESVSADYFIGSPAHLKRGLGAGMLQAAAQEVFVDPSPEASIFSVSHDKRNVSAVRAARSAGFVARIELVEADSTCIVFVRERREKTVEHTT
jgi:RimJ/RimL family protein N-acetyltransferase